MAPLRAGSASTSSAILSWFRRETAPGYLGNGYSGALERLGFSVIRQAGSHVRLAQGDRRVTVPMHRI
ncbi:MAG: type II toxin-antitoxin system HicA family toxin [Bryobacteraceae bacterium]